MTSSIMPVDPYDGIVHQRKKTRNRILIVCAALLVITAIVVAVVVAVAHNKKESKEELKSVSKSLRTMCNFSNFPKECEDTIASSPAYSPNMSIKDLLEVIVDVAVDAAQNAFESLDGLVSKVKEPAQKKALTDCFELMDATLDQLNSSSLAVHGFDILSITDPAGDVQTWLSAAMTNLDTCLEGFASTTSNDVKSTISNISNHVEELCSNALAIITSVSSLISKFDASKLPTRRLLTTWLDEEEEENGQQMPRWLSAGDRRLLQSNNVKANVVVALKGRANYRSIQQAIDKAPRNSKSRYVILVRGGTYNENVEVPRGAKHIFLVGEGAERTIISARKNVVDGSTTFRSATFATVGEGFMARDIQFRNTAGPEKHQAVALRVGADKSVFYRCKMMGYQDTMYAHSLRQFYSFCEIWGTVDFIFGNSPSVFQNCVIRARKPIIGQQCTVTAQGRTDKNMNTGIIIHRSRIGASKDLNKTVTPTYLGRPWKEFSRTVIMLSTLENNINPAGWLPWTGDFALRTLEYREYRNNGPGSATNKRVKWRGYKVITNPKEAMPYTLVKFLGTSFVNTAHVPYVGGL